MGGIFINPSFGGNERHKYSEAKLPVVDYRSRLEGDWVLLQQRALNPTLQAPIITDLAILLLSRPVQTISTQEGECYILDFFGAFWMYGPNQEMHGFFPTIEELIETRSTVHWQSNA
jgi:hypothetical protein